MSLTNAVLIKNKTIIGGGGGSSTTEFIDITYEDWLALSDEEKKAHNYLISNYQGADWGG